MIGPPKRPNVWAKADGPYWHPLIAHSADVASVFACLLQRTQLDNRFRRLFGELPVSTTHRLCFLAALHDAGKANRWFQNQVYGGPTDTHQAPLVSLLRTERGRLSPLKIETINGWFEGVGYAWLETAWSHHGAPLERPQSKGPLDECWDETAARALRRLRRAAERWYPKAFGSRPKIPESRRAQHLFNGALTLADWIASDDSLFNWKQAEDQDLRDPAAAKEVAECRAEKALQSIELDPKRPIETSIEAILPDGHTPYEIQTAVQRAPAAADGSLLVLESPTGSGKTESVLGRYARLAAEGRVDSLFFAAPIRAAAKQLHGRVCDAADTFFGENNVRPHLAIPGYLQAGRVEGFYAGSQVRWDEDIGQSGWAAESSKRFTASQIAVGTTDQVLLSSLKNRHAHLRAAGLSRSLIVIDEIHASSTYMHQALQRVLDLHVQAGGHAVLMSATLGTSVRAAYTGEDEKSFTDARDETYPRVTTRSGGEITTTDDDLPVPGSSKTITVEEEPVASSPQAVASLAAEAARDGARVLVIRNTVSACQATFRQLPSDLSFSVKGVPCPHHSRYAAPDREALDAQIESLYAETDTRRQAGGFVTIATQTVQQSLDIDADLLITDLCPMDVLLQRIGRLHRHTHTYPRPSGFEDPRCIILAPSKAIGAYINPDNGSAFALPVPGAGTVYSPLHIKTTRDALAGRPTITIPEQNRRLVEESLHPSWIRSLAESSPFDKVQNALQASQRRQRVQAASAVIDWEDLYPKQPFPAEQTPTRLGLMTVIAELPETTETPFGHSTDRVPLSPYFFSSDELEDLGDEPAAENVSPTGDGFTFNVADSTFSYTSTGIQKA